MRIKPGIPFLIIALGVPSTMALADVSVRALPPAGIVANAPKPARATPQRNVDVPKPELDEFDTRRVALNATHVDSAAQVKEHISALEGKVLDMDGVIMGIMLRNGHRTILLKMESDTLSLRIPESFKDALLLKPGSAVRALADVHQLPYKPIQLTLIALAPPSAKTSIVKELDTSAVVLPPADGSIAALPAPPEDIDSSPSYQGLAQTSPEKSAKPAKKKAPAKDVDAVVAAQKPMYAKMIKDVNSKLEPAQVDVIAESILRAGLKYKMDPRFLAAIIGVESDYDITCLSSSGAMGLGQLMPFNLKEAGVKDPWDPKQNIFGTAKLLRGHLDDYKDRSNGTLLGVAAYNAGPGAVRRAGYKVPNGAQVRRYVWKVYYRYKALAPDMF